MMLLAHLFGPLGSLFGTDNVIVVVFAFVIILTIIKQVGRWQRDKLWHDTARMAMERGQPIPQAPCGPFGPWDRRWARRWSRSDLIFPRGLILIAVGVGLLLVGPDGIGRWWILPIVIGGAQLIVGSILWITRPRDTRDPFDPMNRPQ